MKKSHDYEVERSLRDIEEYDTKGEIPTRIMSLEADPNTRETNHIGLYMIYQEDITDYIKVNTELKQSFASHTKSYGSYATNSSKT